ncbi:phosphodiester glycosidase family protein [bacterium]|nr:phosphodiester glycosidase family protein [bacterium]
MHPLAVLFAALPLVATPSVAPRPAGGASASVTPANPASTLVGMRVESSPEAVTLWLELTRPVAAVETVTPGAYRLRLAGMSGDRLLLFDQPINDPILKGLRWEQEGPDPVLVVPWGYRLPTRVDATLEAPYRLKVTLQKVFSESLRREVAPGISHQAIRRGTPFGPLSIHALRVDPKAPGVRVAPAMAASQGNFGLETVSAIAQRHQALAAVNGAYFGRGGLPLGLLMIDRKLVTGPIYARTALGFGPATARPVIERAALSAYVELPNGQSAELDGINQARWDDQIVAYTDRWGTRTRTEGKPGALEVAVAPDGQVMALGSNDLPIPSGGFVLSALGSPAGWLGETLKPGMKVKLQVPLSDYFEGVEHVLGGGPRLVDAGEVRVTSEAERFQADVARGRAPRTAVGVTATGELVIVAVDGRSANESVGLTLSELGELMRELGARDAMNLDGGGSTAFVLEGKLMNKPSDGSERPVSNALLIWGDRPPTSF